jgi:23S rRNA pseudouridine1911/1915/1917 synthase
MITQLIQPDASITLTVSSQEQSQRIDAFLAHHFERYSRNFFQKLVEQGHITINGIKTHKPSIKIKNGDAVEVYFPAIEACQVIEDMPDLGVKIVFAHEHFFIIEKPAGLIVHTPSPHKKGITLVDWLMHYCGELRSVGNPERPGIVHRLDKDTSGLMIIPRNNYAHALFGEMFKNRQIQKKYIALVHGHPQKQGSIDYRIDRHRIEPHKMTHLYGSGRQALTHFSVSEYFNDYALLDLKPVTGRTHQIRVHCTAIGHPLVGDSIYGRKSPLIDRHALHAAGLSFIFEGQEFNFTSSLPDDMQKLVDLLRT